MKVPQPLIAVLGLGLLSAGLCCSGAAAAQSAWQPAGHRIMTRWGRALQPENVWPEYPRPQLVRPAWQNLNGLWKYAIRPRDAARPDTFDGRILVPFAVESALSGVGKKVGETRKIWYRRQFRVPTDWQGKRLLLHFGAVDWEATVWVDGREVARHRGGYDPFTAEITGALADAEAHELVVSVWDPADAGTQPRGKQVRRPQGIWYTSVTGIWQTVWLEPVPQAYISGLAIVSDIDAQQVKIRAQCAGAEPDFRLRATAQEGERVVETAEAAAGDTLVLYLREPKLWSPDSPFLYDLRLDLRDGRGAVVDAVTSYFGMRKISLGKDAAGVTRLFLNNREQFQLGTLDQGWWPDGLYTAPSDATLRSDLETLKKLGFNMLRKHVKAEPDRLYYWCDRLGLLVWQDMPSGDEYIGRRDPDLQRSPASAQQFELELRRIVAALYNHPSIVMWVPFNEGWGQHDTARITRWLKTRDPSRLVDSASGWTDRSTGDVHDIHAYPGPAAPENESARAAVLGEFGGLGLPVAGHTWQAEKNWGYRKFEDAEALNRAYRELLRRLEPLIAQGLSAAIYTQTSDVEIEVNGLQTYDRAVLKLDAAVIGEMQRRLMMPRRPR